jgi:hypothetical protein
LGIELQSEHWYADCADAMVREGIPMFQFTCRADLGLTHKECDSVVRSKAFQEIFRLRKNLYYKELANDPSLTKTAVEGMAILAITRLLEKGMDDKALNGIVQFAKIKGWTSDQASVNIFQDLSAKDLAALREKFKPATVSKEN